jgi:hypothetical protein
VPHDILDADEQAGNKTNLKVNAVGREGVGRFYRPAPMDRLAQEGRLSASYPSPYYCSWLLSSQVSPLGHKVL